MATLLPNLFFVGLAIYGLAAVLSLLIPSQKAVRHVSHIGALIGSIAMFLFAGWFLLATPGTLSIKLSLGLLPFSAAIDPLAAFFMLVASLIGICASLFGISYMEDYEHHYEIGGFGAFFNVFLASLFLVASANHALYFLLVWELMSLSSYLLILFEHKKRENVSAAFTYFVMMHIGVLFIAIAFFTLYRATGSFDFSVWRELASSLSTPIRTVSFLLLLLGFGTKAGIIPLHVWLPKAHPAAPSHVSALLSGVMIKIGILMLIRFIWDIFRDAPAWWGLVILTFGALASLLGVLYALAEHDIKRLLAYHSIENIGIILLGLGAAIFFNAHGYATLAALALAAALFHTLNHAIFKALLFFASGIVVRATQTRNIEEMGGLIKKIPITAFLFLIGAMAISALPPLNGFASEWLTFQALFATVGLAGAWGSILGMVAIITLAVTGGLAAACFVKAFGITFLARSRSEHAVGALSTEGSERKGTTGNHDATPFEWIGMGILAVLTLVLGVFAKSVVEFLTSIAGSMRAVPPAPFSPSSAALLVPTTLVSSLDLATVFFALTIVGAVTYLIVKQVTRHRRVTLSRTWDCGFPLSPRMEMTSTAFARSLLLIFRGLVRPSKQSSIEYHDADSRYLIKSHVIELGTHDIYERYLYGPLSSLFLALSTRAKKVQTGNVNMYVFYVFVTLIALLIYATLFK